MKRFIIILLALAVGFGWTRLAMAEETPDFEEMTDKSSQAVKRGLKFLAQHQEASGAYGGGPRIAATPMAGMAFLSHGETPDEGKYAKNLKRAVKFILKQCSPQGFISEAGSRMYEHGFATLFLAEMYGMFRKEEDNKEVKQALTRAMGLLERAQGAHGGWDYNPSPGRSDISITVCQAMAMRASRAAGIKVSPDTVKKAVECLKSAANPDGGFRYTVPGGASSAYPRSAGGMCISYAFGLYNDPKFRPLLEKGVKYLESNKTGRFGYPFYTIYYASHAMYQAGGKHWKDWYPKARDDLVNQQRPDGSWTGGGGGVNFSTGIACIVLQIPTRYLPIVQR